MSRLMLAIKSVFAKTDDVPVLVFDEIDTGISGKAAKAVGEKLKIISKVHQVICITHLAPIAARGDYNYYISKNVREEKPEVKSEPKKEVELAKVEPQTIETCEKFIYDVMNAMGMDDVKVTSVVDEEGALSINMEGSNMGILIGKRGQTLDSLQYLTNRVANKMQDGYVRVKLDTEDYRRRRKETLENLAKNIASKVKRTRKTVSLEPMNPYERRIIHSALQSDPAVSTHSEGEEPYRRVVVTLVRNRNNR